ncbi:hypothetical protein ACHAXS_012521 [Conticribra weissflogii]
MGTLTGCICTTLYYAVEESNTLLSKYKDDLILLKQFIIDMYPGTF